MCCKFRDDVGKVEKERSTDRTLLICKQKYRSASLFKTRCAEIIKPRGYLGIGIT